MNFNVVRKSLAVLGLFVAVGVFDYVTGYELSSYPVYLLPIFLTFFYFGKQGGYLACVVAMLMWVVIDIANGHAFKLEIMRYWNAACRLLIYFLFVYGLSVYHKTIAAHRKRVEALHRLLPMCHGCGCMLWKDGTWKTAEEALELTEDEPFECPRCTAHADRLLPTASTRD